MKSPEETLDTMFNCPELSGLSMEEIEKKIQEDIISISKCIDGYRANLRDMEKDCTNAARYGPSRDEAIVKVFMFLRHRKNWIPASEKLLYRGVRKSENGFWVNTNEPS